MALRSSEPQPQSQSQPQPERKRAREHVKQVTFRSTDGLVYCGYQPRELCCGSADESLHFLEGDVVGCGLVPEHAMVFFTRNGAFLGFVYVAWLLQTCANASRAWGVWGAIYSV